MIGLVKSQRFLKMIKRYQRTSASQYITVGLILVIIIGFGLMSTIIMIRIPFEDHFAIPWAAGRSWLLGGTNPYDSAVSALAAETVSESGFLATLPEIDLLVNPVINLIFYLPFSLIPYTISRSIWITSLALCIGMIGYFALQLSGWKLSMIETISAILLTTLWFPGGFSILTGQLSPIIILLTLFGIYLIIREQDTLAGFLLALTFGSLPTTGLILIAVVVWSISRRRWSIISAFFSGFAFLLVVSLLMLPSWPMDWLRVILNTFSDFDWIQTPLMGLASLLPGIANSLSIFLHVAFIVYLLSLWITLLGKTGLVFIWKTFAVMVVAFLLHIQASIAHLFLLLPAMFIVFRFFSERWGLFGRILSWTLLMLLTTGSWFIVLPGGQFSQEATLPLFAFGLPVLILMGMIWVRWWAIKLSRLPFDGG